MVSITVAPAGKKAPSTARGLPYTVQIPGKAYADVTVGDVKTALAAKYPKLYVDRQKLSVAGSKAALESDVKLSAVGVKDGGEVLVKDLGPQIGWKTVFLIEYAGPLFIHPAFYHLPKLFYGQDMQHSQLQKFVYAFVMLHFVKRELETLFVHRFSHGTMPFTNVFKNSAHYHLGSGLAIAAAVYSPTYAAGSSYLAGTIRENPNFLWACAYVWIWAELSNLHTHITTKNLRPPGTRTRAVPRGYGFDGLFSVSFPNYFFELVGWAVIAGMTGSWVASAFAVVAGGQMAVWAAKKHANYKKEFGTEYPRNRKIMIPFIF
ncbi:hypothetical protein FIBSPDRAFT_931053 [Athelia psychrophila]|uniref:3-oxo-5-alpha-steroid 4-dehydrogenase C-terminal domain-containing protein n=1 Tax=Athelia psychrophila TaxID=1759441 RepID=A0A166L844_9AGAM|nr:hypothetical protein FIBSPDRAFT_900815 [Fibularhizoctonia sp. CBS 109695]KZP22676.1 hypothetical protein FIBSPDRAFT_931053 [Fibularhizoctonia sp. CBS 109695]